MRQWLSAAALSRTGTSDILAEFHDVGEHEVPQYTHTPGNLRCVPVAKACSNQLAVLTTQQVSDVKALPYFIDPEEQTTTCDTGLDTKQP